MINTVLLVDDHSLIRQGLRSAFEQTDDFQVVAEAASVAEALAHDRAHQPDVLVVDVNLGDGDGMEVVRQVRSQRPAAGLVVLTMYDGDDIVLAALEAGASCLVLKQATVEQVIQAARRAVAAPGTFAADGLAAVIRRKLAAPTVLLSGREQELLLLLVQGLSVAEMSARLFVGATTTKSYLAKVYEKLGAENRTQAVMAAVRLGLVTVER